MTAAQPRPRVVDVAFWLWVTGAVLLVLGGGWFLAMTVGTVDDTAADKLTDDEIHALLMFYRGAGLLCIVLGVAVAYLAVRARRGDKRFRRAAVALTVVGAALLAASAWLIGLTLPALLATLFLVIGAALMMRPAAEAWFDAVDGEKGSAG